MKSLAIIWAFVLIVGTASGLYINHSLNTIKILPEVFLQLQPAQPVDLGNNTCLQACNEPNIQPAQPLNN